MIDRVLNPGPLKRCSALDPKAFPKPRQGYVERQLREVAPPGANIAGRIETERGILRVNGIADENPVLQQADLIMTKVELQQTVAEQRMIDGCPDLPCPLRQQLGIATVDALRRKIGTADEVVEIELGDRPTDGEKACQPPPAGFQSSVMFGLEELELAVLLGMPCSPSVGRSPSSIFTTSSAVPIFRRSASTVVMPSCSRTGHGRSGHPSIIQNGDGLLKLDLGHDQVSLLQTRILICDPDHPDDPTLCFDAPGNIGTGRRDFAQLTLDIPCRSFGRACGSRVEQRFAGAGRGPDQSPDAQVEPDSSASWQWNADVRRNFREMVVPFSRSTMRSVFTFYRTDEFDTNFKIAAPIGRRCVEYRPWANTAITFDIDNMFETSGNRDRLRFFPNRATPPISSSTSSASATATRASAYPRRRASAAAAERRWAKSQ